MSQLRSASSSIGGVASKGESVFGNLAYAFVCGEAIEATEVIHATADYRQHLAVVLSRRALEKACGLKSMPVMH